MTERWVIECRDENGMLDFRAPQPEGHFGMGAITGMTDDEIAKKIYAACPDAVLVGDYIPNWPRLIDERWTARRKTW